MATERERQRKQNQQNIQRQIDFYKSGLPDFLIGNEQTQKRIQTLEDLKNNPLSDEAILYDEIGKVKGIEDALGLGSKVEQRSQSIENERMQEKRSQEEEQEKQRQRIEARNLARRSPGRRQTVLTSTNQSPSLLG